MNYVVPRSVKNKLLVAMMGLACGQVYARQNPVARPDSATVVRRVEANPVTGTITDASTGKPLPGISVTAGQYSATITDEKGRFRISVPGYDAVLNFNGQGFQAKEIALKGRKAVTAALYEESYNSIYGSVRLPYTIQSKLHTANAVEAVNSDDNWQRTSESSDTYLQGRMPGLNIVRRSGTPGIGGNLFLHGFTSLYATNQPLILVDGMLYDNFSYGNSIISGHVSNPLSNIDIKDVDSYTLIKDGSSFYGARGANGALLITTNRAKGLATTIDAAVYGGYNQKVSNIPVMNAADYRIYLSDLLTTVPGETPATIQSKPYLNDSPNPDYYRYHNETNWQNEVLGDSYNQNYYLEITGGDNIATYGLSVGYLKGSGITRNTDLQRYQTRFNADLNLSSKLTAQANLSFVNNQQNLQNQGIAPKSNPLYLALVKAPFLRPHDVTATNEESPNLAGADVLNTSNPSALIDDMRGSNRNYRFLGSVSFKFELTKKVSLQSLLGVNYDKVRENLFIPQLGVVPDTLAQAIVTNNSATNTQRLYSLYNDSRVSYTTKFNTAHSLSANLGIRYNRSEREVDSGRGFSSATDDYISVGSGLPALRTAGGENGKWNWMNVYANADYELLNKYFLSLNMTADGSSRFGKDAGGGLDIGGNQFALMPSIAAAWLVSSEHFLTNAKYIDVLKFRASYGLVGNDDIGNYTARQYYTSQNLLGSQGIVRGNTGNTHLKWETVKKTNLGADAALFNERLNLTVDYFNNKTVNMITLEPQVSVAGFSYAITNNSSMKTHGFDLGLSGRVINRSVKLDLGVNLSNYKNELTQIPGNQLLTAYAGGTIISQVGQPANQFFGFKTNGVYTSDAEAATSGLKNRRENGTVTSFRGGDIRFTDTNGDGFIDNDDRQVIGDPNPELTGAFTTMASYKHWSMDAVLTFTSGNDIYNYTRRGLESMNGLQNQLNHVRNRWRVPGQVTEVPRAEFGDPAGNARFSDRWIEDGGYLRLRTLSLTYDIPKIGNAIKSAKIYLTGNNIFTVTKYLGYDPEFSATGSVFSQGTDIGLEPQFRTIQLGLRVGL